MEHQNGISLASKENEAAASGAGEAGRNRGIFSATGGNNGAKQRDSVSGIGWRGGLKMAKVAQQRHHQAALKVAA